MSWPYALLIMGGIALYCAVFVAAVCWAINCHERNNR